MSDSMKINGKNNIHRIKGDKSNEKRHMENLPNKASQTKSKAS